MIASLTYNLADDIHYTMPTSSQAMILRCTDSSRLQITPVIKNCLPFANDRPTYRDFNVKFSPPSTSARCERVQFDFNLSATPNRSIDGFEGVFAYDETTKSYRWQIFSVAPKERNNFPDLDKHDKDDHLNEENCKSGHPSSRESFEYDGHFTTPAESLESDTSFDTQSDQQTIHQKEVKQCINEEAYRWLEELGFRKRTANLPGGALIRMSKEESRSLKTLQKCSSDLLKTPQKCPSEPLKTPQKCSSEQLAIPKLSLKNLGKNAPLKPQKLASGDYFSPQSYICGESVRKRVKPTTHKSLLEEVKKSVNWANRVTPSTHHRSVGYAQNLHFAACFSLRDSWKYDHAQVKALVESQTQCQVRGLHFDPVSLRTEDRSVLDRWIITFKSSKYCTRAIERGLSVDGDKVVVRSWDNIVREEQGDDLCYPCNFQLPSDKHDRVLRKFLQVH